MAEREEYVKKICCYSYNLVEMNCETCGKSFTGIVSYNQHMNSEKHKRKMISINMSNVMETNSNEVPVNEEVSLPVNTQDKIQCSVCGLSFDSLDSFTSHSLSLEHATKVRNSENTNKMFCSVCDISFDSLQSYRSHSESLDHADNVSKKFQNNADYFGFGVVSSSTSNDYSSKNSTVLSGVETDTVVPPVPSYETSYLASYASCKVCGKQFSGPEPYKQHLVSAAHKKKVEMQNYVLVTGGSLNFNCEPCNKVFSGQIPYQQHLISDVHRKKLQSIQLLEEWNRKEIKPNSVTDDSPDGINPSTGGNGLNDTSVNHLWFCKICVVQCSGHIPYKQHLDGETHLKNERKAEVLKGKAEITLVNLCTPLLPSQNNTNVFPQPTLQTENNTIHNIQAGITIQNLQTPNNAIQNMEVDTLLPLAMQNLAVISADELNLKEFLPEEKIDFDKGESNETQNITENVSEETAKDVEEIKVEVYKECKYCNVQLKSKDEALSHFESVEHFDRRWNSK